MTARELKTSGRIVGFCWGACVAAVMCSAYGLMQTQDAIDNAVAEQRVIACSEIVAACQAPGESK